MFLFNDIKAQMTIEFILLVGFFIILIIPLAMHIIDSSELNQAMASARTGALEGAISDGLAVYPDDAYKDYSTEHMRLLSPSTVKITKIDYVNQGFNPTYQKTKIQLRIHVSSPNIVEKTDKNCLGDRINFYVRKKICQSFDTQNLTNSVFNPAFSNKYVFTTADVYWD
jgi:hypothetical protein